MCNCAYTMIAMQYTPLNIIQAPVVNQIDIKVRFDLKSTL